jgi:hypothetical protein
MYGLPSDTNLDFLVTKILIQVCFGANDLILNFTDDISIAIFSSIGIGPNVDTITRHSNFTEISNEILKLLNQQISKIRWTTEGTLSLTINGTVLLIFDDSEQFESYTIKPSHGQQIIV